MQHWNREQLIFASPILGHLVTGLTERQAHHLRDGEDGWTVTEVMCHLRDYERIFIKRIHLTQEEDNPTLPAPDPDTLAQESNYNATDPYNAYADWVNYREKTIRLFDGVSDWERTGFHANRGPMNLSSQLALIVWHDMNHMQQIATILS